MSTSSAKPASAGRVFDFDWADDVDETLYINTSTANTHSPSVEVDHFTDPCVKEHFEVIEGVKYKYAAGTRPGPIFSLQKPDARYAYDDEPTPDLISPTSEGLSDDLLATPSTYSAQESAPNVHGNKFAKRKKNGRKRHRKHTKPTPGLTPSSEYYENEAAEDSFQAALPKTTELLEPVEPTAVVEDLWADFKKARRVPLYLG